MVKTILIIDDNELIIRTLKRMITRVDPDYTVIAVGPTVIQSFETAALLAISQNKIDLMITDGELISNRGIEYGPRLARKIGEMSNIPIILMSGNYDLLECRGQFANLQDCLAYIEERIEKPFEEPYIRSLLKKFLFLEEGAWTAKLISKVSEASKEEIILPKIDQHIFLKRHVLEIIDIAPECFIKVRLIESGTEKLTQYGLINPSSLKFQNKEELEKI